VRGTYSEGKRVAEHLAAIYHRRHGLAVTIARGFAFVGPYLPLDGPFAIGNFLRDGLAGGPVRVGGDGTPYRSYLYAADLAVWLWTILLRGTPCRPYNVGSEQDIAIAALARKIADVFQTEVHVARPAEPGKVPERYVPSTRRARTELGLDAWIGLDDGIARTLRWQRRQTLDKAA
jgi:dTDP-glucose 4,6-dehydratase